MAGHLDKPRPKKIKNEKKDEKKTPRKKTSKKK